MKNFYLLSCFLFLTAANGFGQSAKQVQWTYTAKKVNDKIYEVHMTATIGDGYHMYAQNAGVEGPLPTTFHFTNNPLFTLNGKAKENGKLIKKAEQAWNGSVNYYENTVEFVQQVTLKSSVKTALAGSVEFMVCNDSRCLPPSTVEFKVNIGG